jgi:hypothetical protein
MKRSNADGTLHDFWNLLGTGRVKYSNIEMVVCFGGLVDRRSHEHVTAGFGRGVRVSRD